MVICLGRGADFHIAQLMPLPLTISFSYKSRLVWFYLPSFTFLVLVHPGSHGQNQESCETVVVVVIVFIVVYILRLVLMSVHK